MSWYGQSYRHSLAARRISLYSEIKRIHRPVTRREYLYGDIEFLRNAIKTPDLSNQRLAELQSELDHKEMEFRRMSSPRRLIKVSEMDKAKSWEERYKGTKGRRPAIISDLPLYIDTLKSPQEKSSDYRQYLKELSDERAANKAMERINEEILSGNIEETITPFVLKPIKRGRVSSEEPDVIFTE